MTNTRVHDFPAVPIRQYTVTVPPELAAEHYEKGTVFRWRVRSGGLLLEPTGEVVDARSRRPNKVWDDRMDAIVLAKEKPDKEIAVELGVTIPAIVGRRYYLTHREA